MWFSLSNLSFVLIVLSLIIVLTMTGCSSNEEIQLQSCSVEKAKGAAGDIIGSWKLVKQDRLFVSPVEIDHSCNDITFSFKMDSTYAVSSDIPAFSSSYNSNMEYQLQSIDQSKTIFVLTTRSAEWRCTVSEYEMIWDNTLLDAGRMLFVRIK